MVLIYVLELAKCDLNYDVRDRAHFLKKLLSTYLDSQGLQEETNCPAQHKDSSRLLAEILFGKQKKPVSHEPVDHRFYLPGSLSQMVLHAAPRYELLPKPCSLRGDGPRLNEFGEAVTNGDQYVTDNEDSASESLDVDVASSYSLQRSNVDSSGSDGSEEAGSVSEGDDDPHQLIQFSDERKNGTSQSASDFGELLSNRALESWLDDQPGFSNPNTSEQSQVRTSSARISIGDLGGQVRSKSYPLLDPVNGNGLKVDYWFSSEISSISPRFICIEVSFKNCSKETMSDVTLVDEEAGKGKDSVDQALFSDERCTFTDHIKELDDDNSLVENKFLVICQSLALKMLSNANLHLVSVDLPVAAKLDDATGLCLRFSSKILSTSVPCLITVTVEGRCTEPLEISVKVNCEETVFGLNLLNRIVNFSVEPSHTHM